MLKHKKSLLACLVCVLMASLASLLVLSACGKKSYNFQSVTVYHGGEEYISPSALALKDGSIFVSDATANKLYKLNDSGTVIKSYDFNEAVNSVYVNGNDVYALVGGLAGEIYRFNTSLELQNKAETGHTPNDALVIGEKIYVANRFSNTVSVFNKDLTSPTTIKIDGREPFALASAQDKLYVACKLSGGAANEDVVAANLCVIDPATDSVTKSVKLINGTNSVNGIAVSSDGNYVYLANIFARYTYPTSQLDRGWVNTNGITVFDAVNDEVVAGVLVDGVEWGAANLWGIDVIGEGGNAEIVCAVSGLSQLAVIPEKAMLDKIASVKDGTGGFNYGVDEIVDRVEFLNGIATRIEVGGKGVRDISLAEEDGERYAYVTQYFDGTVSKVALSEDELGVNEVTQYKLGTQGAMTQERMGEILWNDATICYQGWESCSSCHPGGRADGLNWDELGDGIGTPKQTKSMLYSHRTPPVLVTGVVDAAETNVMETVMFAFHNDLEQEQYDCMDAYLRSLKPVQSPYLNRDGTLTESAKNGQKLFNEYNCNSCHSGPFFTDMQKHESASLETDDSWEDRDFDTPSLVEIWRTSPYMFNGNAVTMEETVKFFIEEDGKTATDAQIKDIANFILSIGDSGEYYGVEQVFFAKSEGESVHTLLEPGTVMNKVTVRKQWDTEKKALITVTLYNEKGSRIGDSVYAVLTDMKTGDYASFELNMQISENLAKGSYYEITITDPDDTDVRLATPLRIYYK